MRKTTTIATVYPQEILDEFKLTIDAMPLIRPSDNALGDAAKRFSSIKDNLDALALRPNGEPLLYEFLGDQYVNGTVGAFCYADAVLPFFRYVRLANTTGKQYQAMVLPDIVVGESWKWHPAQKTATEKNHVIRATFDGIVKGDRSKAASYVYIPKLDIVLAHEGKNRVALFRELKMAIPAFVREVDYPESGRIRLFCIAKASFAVLDNRYLQCLRLPEITKRTLVAYGVKQEVEWPDSYPSMARIDKLMRNECFTSSGKLDVVDMLPLLDEQRADQCVVKVSIVNMDTPLSLLRSSYPLGLFFIVLCGMGGLLFDGMPILQTIFFSVAAALCGVWALFFMPIFSCQVQDLDEDIYQSKRIELIAEYERKRST